MEWMVIQTALLWCHGARPKSRAYQKTIVDQEHFVEDERIVQYKTLQSGVLMKEKRVGG
jgi:hypothetical protein